MQYTSPTTLLPFITILLTSVVAQQACDAIAAELPSCAVRHHPIANPFPHVSTATCLLTPPTSAPA